MTEQLTFDLAAPEPPSFANFVAAANAEAVTSLAAVAAGNAAVPVVLLWGGSGSGKTHLLRAAVAAAIAGARPAAFVADPGALLAHDAQWLGSRALVAVDALEAASPAAQAQLFTTFNALHERGGNLVVAAGRPLAALGLREDLRTRLGSGLVYELTALADDHKPAALAEYARQRGFALNDEVIAYLLAHGRRDMSALVQTLGALDRQSLATKRPITIPMLRNLLQRQAQSAR